MYLHQSNNLNGINLSSNHTLNSLTSSLKMSDLHNNAFHNHLNLNQTPSSPTHQLNQFTNEQNEENYLGNYSPHYQSNGKLIDEHQFDYTDKATDKLNKINSQSPPLAISSSTLNNITNISNFISNHSNQTAKQLNGQQLVDESADDDCTDKSNIDQNDFTGMDPMTRFMSLHPKYLELYEKFNNFLFNGDGSLQYTVRHYIAIMAAARHHCKYLVNAQQEQFKKVGGDVNWLKGLQHAPKKIQNLNEINKILAHQPWLLTKMHIERLTKGDDSWSLSELMQAIVIMTQFHSLASFVFGCGFNEVDADLEWVNKKSSLNFISNINSNNISDLLFFDGQVLPSSIPNSAPPSPPSNSLVNINGLLTDSIVSNDSSVTTSANHDSQTLNSAQHATRSLSQNANKSTEQANTLEILMRKMQNISEQKQQQIEMDNQEELVKNQSLEIHLTPTQTLTNEFNSANSTGQQSTNQKSTSPSQLTSKCKCLGDNDEQFEISKFVLDSKFCYEDFARQRARTDVTTFKVQDYSWSDHGYSLVNRLYSDVGASMLDEKFTTTYNLTYYTMGRSTNVDTRLFRQAIWNYIQCMYGIRHDDYDYHEINDLLERPLKTYIKTVCCFPHQTRRKDCDEVMSEFRRSEKIHVNIMITEARLQAELLYALRTIYR